MTTLAPSLPVESRALLQNFVERSARATIIVPGYPSQCPARLAEVDDDTVIVKAFDPVWIGRLLNGIELALVTIRESNRYGCFFATIRRVGDDGRVVFELPKLVSLVEQRQAARRVVPDGSEVRARLEHAQGACTAHVCDVSASGIGVRIDEGASPPAIGAKVELVVGTTDHELTLPSTVAFVDGRRVGVAVDTTAGTDLLLEFAALLGQARPSA